MTITYLPNASKKFNLEKTSYKKKRIKWIYLKKYPARKTALFHQKSYFTEKNKNITPLLLLPDIFIKFHNNSCVKYSDFLWEITTGAVAIAPRRKP
jgi:hypothetical protein